MKTGVKIHSVKFNVLMNMVVTCSSFLFPLITIPYVSRVLGTDGTGAVAFAQSVSSYFSLVALLGITYYGIRVCAAVRDDRPELSRCVKELLVILAVSTTFVSIIYFICIFVVPQFVNERILFLEFGLTIWLTSFGVEWFYQALEQYGYITIRSVAFKFIALLLMILFVRGSDDYVIYGFTVIFAGCASNVLNMWRLTKLVDFRTKQKLNIKRHFKSMKWFMIASISSGMYIQVDIVLLGFIGTTSMVGLYQLVSKIKSVLVTAVNSVGNVMLPRLSYYTANGSRRQADLLISKNINFVMTIGCEIIGLLFLCARQIVLIMGGAAFLDSVRPLSIIGFAVLFSSMNIVLANQLITNGSEKKWATVNVIGLSLAVVSNFLLIPICGVFGAALSIVICEGAMLIMRLYLCRDLLVRIWRMLDPGKIIISLIASYVVTYMLLLSTQVQNPFVSILFAFIFFSSIYLSLLFFLKECFVYDMFKQFITKLNK